MNSNFPPKWVVCVGTVVLKQDQVLFIRQAEGQSLAGQWSIPWGFVDNNETPEHAAVRETQEESGIHAEVEGLLGIQNLQPGWMAVIFLCQHLAGEPTPDGVETDRARYLSVEAIAAFEQPIAPWCAWIARRVLAQVHTCIPLETAHPLQPKTAFL